METMMDAAAEWDSDDWFWFVELVVSAKEDRLVKRTFKDGDGDPVEVNELDDLGASNEQFLDWYDELRRNNDPKQAMAIVQDKLTEMEVCDYSQISHDEDDELHAPPLDARALMHLMLDAADNVLALWAKAPPTNDIERADKLRALRELRRRGMQIFPKWEK
jgi:hypothetical protein